MTEVKKDFCLKDLLTIAGWRSFFMGNAYPALVCALVLFGNLTALDYYVNFLVTALFVFAVIISDSVRPLIITVCTYIYQVSIPHAPSYPTYSDFLFSGWRKPVSVMIILIVAFSFIYFFVKKKIYSKLSVNKSPLLLPIIAFSIALILNGTFSSDWTYKNLIFGFLNIIVYFFFFYFVFYGFSEKEKSEELVKYFAYISLLMAALIILEMAHLFITSDKIFEGGSIDKESVALGWGIWNIMGTSLAVLIPTLFLGVFNNKYPWLYFSVATLTYIFAVLTMSRNALVFATLAYGASVIISCFVGKNKKAFRIIMLVGILAVLLFAVVFFDKIKLILGDYFERGFSDNGRYDLWRLAVETFKKAVVFGNGFYGFFTDAVFEFGNVPRMAHNTILELLAAMGIFGILSYLWYRTETAILFFRRPSITKTMLGISILVFLFGSLLDNFVFNIHPPLYYTVALAIACRTDCEQKGLNL